MKKASLDVSPLLAISTSPFNWPCSVMALLSVPLRPYLLGLAKLCIISTASDISTSPSQLTSPHIVIAESETDVLEVAVVIVS